MEHMLLADRRNILEIWRKIFGDLEKHVAKYVGDLEKNMFGDLEKTCLAIWRKRVRRFGENVFDDLEKLVQRKHGRCSYGDFVLEFVME